MFLFFTFFFFMGKKLFSYSKKNKKTYIPKKINLATIINSFLHQSRVLQQFFILLENFNNFNFLFYLLIFVSVLYEFCNNKRTNIFSLWISNSSNNRLSVTVCLFLCERLKAAFTGKWIMMTEWIKWRLTSHRTITLSDIFIFLFVMNFVNCYKNCKLCSSGSKI